MQAQLVKKSVSFLPQQVKAIEGVAHQKDTSFSGAVRLMNFNSLKVERATDNFLSPEQKLLRAIFGEKSILNETQDENSDNTIQEMLEFANERLDSAIKNTHKTTKHIAKIVQKIEQRHSA